MPILLHCIIIPELDDIWLPNAKPDHQLAGWLAGWLLIFWWEGWVGLDVWALAARLVGWLVGWLVERAGGWVLVCCLTRTRVPTSLEYVRAPWPSDPCTPQGSGFPHSQIVRHNIVCIHFPRERGKKKEPQMNRDMQRRELDICGVKTSYKRRSDTCV